MSQCHRNVAKLWVKKPRALSAIGTGYAPSDDGLWRQHSWGSRADGKVVEPTVVRVKYFGLMLKNKEAALFARLNVEKLDT